MVKNLACIVGRHKWQYTEAEYNSATEERLGLSKKPPTRVCGKCGKKQVGSMSCLGMKPPMYEVTWKDV